MSEIDQKLIQKFFHLGERTLADMENPVPNLTDAGQLSDPAMLAQFEAVVKKLVEMDDGETALLGRRLLEDILLPQAPQLQDAREIYERYQKLIIILKFINLSVRGLPEIQNLISQHLLLAMRVSVPVKAKFQRVLEVYDDIMMDGTIAEALGKTIQTATEKLGTETLKLRSSDKRLPPALGNWVSDYFQSVLLPTGREKIPGSVDRISYVNQSLNVRQLAKEDKDLLLHVLELYDWLRFGDNPALLQQMFSGSQAAIPIPAPKAPQVVQPVVAKKMPPPPVPRPAAPVAPIVKPAPVPVTPPVIKIPQATQPAPARPAAASNEELYRQTLEELRKMREVEKNLAAPSKPQPLAPIVKPAPSPVQRVQPGPAPADFSINDALARAGLKAKENESQQTGEVITGSQPQPDEDEIDKELKDLDQRIKSGQE